MQTEENQGVGLHAASVFVPINELKNADSPRRRGEDLEHIRVLAEAETPPILVHRRTMRVIDGMHRLRAAKLNGSSQIEVEFFDGSEADAFLLAVGANTAHGLPLVMADRKAAALRIVRSHPDMSNREIARCVGLSDKTVTMIRRSSPNIPHSNVRMGADGRSRPLSASEGRLRAAKVIAERPQTTLREVAREAGISLGTALDVRQRLDRGLDAVPSSRHRKADSTIRKERSAIPAGSDPSPAGPSVGDTRRCLERLGRDPAVRSTDSGRELLRWLWVHEAALRKWPELMSAIPPHCVDAVAWLLQQYSDSWPCLRENPDGAC